MGIIALIITVVSAAAPIAAKITSDMVNDLKRQIKKIVDSHKTDVDKLKDFQTLLQQLDLQKVYIVMKNVSENMSGNFKTFLADQQERIKIIKQLKIKQLSDVSLTGVLGELLQMLTIVGTGLMAIQIATATNPVTIVLSGVMFILNGVLGIFTTIENIMEINELKKKKEDLIEYFKAGGQFQQAQQKLKQSAIDVIKNFYLLIFNGKNLLKTLSVRVMLLQLEKQSEIDYSRYLRALEEDYFDPGFERLVINAYIKLVEINNDTSLNLASQISRMYSVVEEIMSRHNVPQKLERFTKTLKKFSSEGTISYKLQRQYDIIHRLNENRVNLTKRFEMRQDRSKEDLIDYDENLLERMNQEDNFLQWTLEHQKKLQIAELTSFFTAQFYGDPDDKSGKTLYGYNLAEMQKTTRLLAYADAFSTSNSFLLPEPVNSQEKIDWNLKKTRLIEGFMTQYSGQDNPRVQSIYMRMQNQKKTVAESQILILNIYYGVVMKIRGDIIKFEISLEDLHKSITPSNIYTERLNSYINSGKFFEDVTSPAFIQEVDFITKGQINGTLHILEQAKQFILSLPHKWIQYKIGQRTIEEHAKNFKGLSINLREVQYYKGGVHLKNDSIPLANEKFQSSDLQFICCKIIMFITGTCKPWKVEAIDIVKNGDNYQGTVEWSDQSSHENYIGKVVNQTLIKGVKELQDIANKLRGNKRELFIVTITNLEEVICWYLE